MRAHAAALALLGASGASASSCAPFHVHIASGVEASSSMTVSFSTTSVSCASTVGWGTSSSSVTTIATNSDGCKTYSTTSSSYGSYTSDCLHHVTIAGLQPSTKYYYAPSTGTDIFSFTTAPAVGTGFPINFAVLGDLGQTSDSLSTIQHIQTDPSVSAILHAGDMAYADCDQPLWDSYFDLIESTGLSQSMPWFVVPGNHEIETCSGTGNTFVSYDARYRMPFVDAAVQKPSPGASCTPSAFIGYYDYGNAFYKLVYGPATVLMLNSYTSSAVGSNQYKWVQAALAEVDRTVTPWIIVVYHSPYYNSNKDHQNEEQEILMRSAMEPLFVDGKVNLILSGHVHAYERTYPVAYNSTSSSGPIYVVTGEAGNREGHAGAYQQPQPAWSAFRDNTIFGHGYLQMKNETNAVFTWMKNTGTRRLGEDGEEVDVWATADSVNIYNSWFL